MADAPESWLMRVSNGARDFLQEKHITLDRPMSATYRIAHFWMLVVRNFVKNRCPVRASALAYTTLLAMVPMLAIALSVATAILQKEGERPVRELIDSLVQNIAPSLDLQVKRGDVEFDSKRSDVVTKITDFIANIRTGTLGVTSTIALMFLAISLLRTIEATFNDIWGVTRGRTWLASIVTYWAVITLGPVLLITAISLTSGSHSEVVRSWFAALPITVTALVFAFLPLVLVAGVFTLLYRLMPNTKVDMSAAMVGGGLAGMLWQLNGHLNSLYVSRVVTYSKIYGTLGIIPLFLIGLYFSWLILLFGGQVAYAYQNRHAYLQEKQAEGVNQRGREFIALRVMAHIAAAFVRGEGPQPGTKIAAQLGVPSRLTGQLLHPLVQAGIVAEAQGPEIAYTPARPLDQITVHDITHALRAGQGQELATQDDALRAVVREQFERVSQAEREVAAGTTMQDLVRMGQKV